MTEIDEQTTFNSLGLAEWEAQRHDQEIQQKQYCKECRHSVGDDPVYCGVGGILSGPWCSETCFWKWMEP